MKRILPLLVLTLFGALSGITTLHAAEEGFTTLFNGKNLDGWVGATDGYDVEEGAIVCNPKKGGNLYYGKEFDNFVLRFEFKLEPGANNGVAIRSPVEGNSAYNGIELQVLDTEADVYKNIKPYQAHGSVYGVVPAKRGFLKPTGEWNVQEVVADGNQIKITLNGEVIVDADIKEASKDGTLDGSEHPGLLNKSGHIGFLGHGTKVSFRNIRAKSITK